MTSRTEAGSAGVAVEKRLATILSEQSHLSRFDQSYGRLPWSWVTCPRWSSSDCKVSTRGGKSLGSPGCKGFSSSPRCSTLSTNGHLRSLQLARQASKRSLVSVKKSQTSILMKGSSARLDQIDCSNFNPLLAAIGSSKSIKLGKASQSNGLRKTQSSMESYVIA